MESTLCAVCCVWQSIEKKMENINTHRTLMLVETKLEISLSSVCLGKNNKIWLT